MCATALLRRPASPRRDTVADVAGVLTALAGLVGAIVAAYKLLKPSPAAEEEAPAAPTASAPPAPAALSEHDQYVADLREAIHEANETVHALRRRLDRATGETGAELPLASRERGPAPGTDWLSR